MPPIISGIVAIPHRSQAPTGPRTPVDPERVLAGQPAQSVANAYSSPDDAFHCGLWEADAGAWRVHYTEHECCHMLAGKVRITADDGTESVFAAGDSFVIAAGFSGVWEVLEPARKLYAVYEPGPGSV